MSEKKLFIPILLGTVRQGRQSEKAAKLLEKYIQEKGEIETQLFDPRDMHLPMDDENDGLKEKNPKWRDAIIRADGLIIVSPEYNHGYPGSLKRALDLLLPEYIHKAVGLVGVSKGSWGGTRVIEQLVQAVRELGLAVTFTDLNFPKVQDAFDDQGNPKDERVYKRIDGFLEELSWMAKTLRWGRENVPSKYHEK
jgi:NAD(P)H-dependent FMN reductase